MKTCPNCWRDRDDTAYMCEHCCKQLLANLEYISRYATDLEEYKLNRSYGHSATTGTRTTQVNAPEPVRHNVFLLLYDEDGLELTLKAFARCLALSKQTQGKTLAQTAKEILCAREYNGATLIRKCLHDTTTPMYAEQLATLVERMKTFLDPDETETVIIGPCPNRDCGISLSIHPHDKMAECPKCHSSWTVDYLENERRKRILASGHTGTLKQLRKLLEQCGVKVNGSTSRNWVHRGKLKPVEPASDTPRYKLSDAYMLATQTPPQEQVNLWDIIEETLTSSRP